MSNFKTLGEIVSDNGLIVDGDWVESKDQDPNGKVRLLQLADVGVGRFIDKSSRFMTEEKAKELKCTFLKKGDILIARMPDPIGRACIFPGSSQQCVTVVDVCILRVNPKEFDNLWLMYMINSTGFYHQILEFVSGTTRKRIARKKLEQLGLNCPPLETQKQIAAVLEQADQLRKDCKLLEQELNSLAQSVFIEMFGDPVTNPKGWDVRAIGTTFDLLTDYHANGSYEILQENVTLLNEGYALMVRTTDLERNNFTDGVNYISEHAYEFLTKTKVFGNELIVNKIGSAGKVYLMPVLNRPVSLAMNQFMIRFNEELASSIFMYYLLTSKGGIQAIQKKVKGAVTKTIRKDALREIALPIPPKVKQDEFSQFIKQHKKLLDDHKSSKEECEKSFNAIMQKAFKGELNL